MGLLSIKYVLFIALFAYLVYQLNNRVVVQIVNSTYDYIIVGAGSAGAVLAARLSEDTDIRVLLLEGRENVHHENFSVPAAAPITQGSPSDWVYHTTPQKETGFAQPYGRNEHYWPRGKILGGSSMLNIMQYVRGSRHDYDDWKENGKENWGYDDVLPYFLKSEVIQKEKLKNSKYHRSGGPLTVTKETEISLARRFVDAGKELGYELISMERISLDLA